MICWQRTSALTHKENYWFDFYLRTVSTQTLLWSPSTQASVFVHDKQNIIVFIYLPHIYKHTLHFFSSTKQKGLTQLLMKIYKHYKRLILSECKALGGRNVCECVGVPRSKKAAWETEKAGGLGQRKLLLLYFSKERDRWKCRQE